MSDSNLPAEAPDATDDDASGWDSIFAFLRRLLKAAALLVVAVILVVAAAAYYLGPRDVIEFVFGSRDTDLTTIAPAAGQEWRLAASDHLIIATAVAGCSKIYDLAAQPDYIRAQLRLDTLPDGRRVRPFTKPSDHPAQQELVLSNYHRTAIFLSDYIVRARAEAAAAVANYASMFWFQLAIVSIGAITTILISIKSISNANVSSRAANIILQSALPRLCFRR